MCSLSSSSCLVFAISPAGENKQINKPNNPIVYPYSHTNNTVDLLTTNPTPSPSLPPLPALSASLNSLSSLIDEALAYVQKVNAGTEKGNPEVGRYLLEGVGRWSQNEGAADGEGVKDGLQDTLTVSFLANLVRSQVELAGRLQLLPQAQQ